MKKYFFLFFLLTIHAGLFLSATMSAELCDGAIRLRRLYSKCPGIDYAHARATIVRLHSTIDDIPNTAFIDTDQLSERIMNLLQQGFFVPLLLQQEWLTEKRDRFFQERTDEFLRSIDISAPRSAKEKLRDFVFLTILECALRQLRERNILAPSSPLLRKRTVQRSYSPRSLHLNTALEEEEDASLAVAMEVWRISGCSSAPAAAISHPGNTEPIEKEEDK